MLRTIHKYRKSLLGILVVACISLVMTGFGLDFFNDDSATQPAIKIGQLEISQQEFEQKRQQQLDSLHQRFGNDYWRLVQAIGLDINKQVVDSIINQRLLLDEAKKLGLEAGDTELVAEIEKLFPEGFSLDSYRQMLSQLEMNTQQFESELRDSLVLQTLSSLIGDATTISNSEAQALFEKEESLFDIQYVKIEAEQLKEKLAQPSEQQLSEYYQQHVLEYEQPATVSYQYLAFEPKRFVAEVDVSEQDIELYYVDHQKEFSQPERVKIKELELGFTDKLQPEVEALANQIITEIKSGKDITELLEQYAEDNLKQVGEKDGAWVERGKRSADFDAKVFSLQGPGVADLIKLEQKYSIIKVEEYQSQKLIPLADVREKIVGQIRESLAPAYARDRAEATLLKLKSGETDLATVAENQKLKLFPITGLLPANQDPAGWRGLTKKVLEQKDSKWQLIDINDSTVLVETNQFKESFIPAFAELGDLREKLLNAYLDEQAQKAASKTSEKIFKNLKDNSGTTLADVAKEFSLTLKKNEGLKAAEDMPEDLSDPQIKKAIFSTSQKGSLPRSAIKVGGDYYIIQVVDIKKPSKEAADQLNKYREMAKARAAELILEAVVNRLKAESEIEIDPALLTNKTS